jgi:hypothetical protein
MALLELQDLIAQETALSIMSDHISEDVIPIPAELHAEQPLWQVLAVLSDTSMSRSFYWRSVGACLVFHRKWWPLWALKEVPESLILACREKLHAQGQLTLSDVSRIYAELADLPQFEELMLSWPDDLRQAGCSMDPYTRRALLLYASLSPEQVGKAHSPSGLAFSELSTRQRQELVMLAAQPWMELSEDEAVQITIRAARQTQQEPGSEMPESPSRAIDQYEFVFEVKDDPERSGRAVIRLPRAGFEPGDL